MRVTFPRLPDHERAWALVERDDGVVYRLYSGTAGPRLPHDIMHLVVERELRISDGIWAGIAAGGADAFLRVGDLNASSIYGCQAGQSIFFSTMVEPSAVNTDREVHLVGSRDGAQWQTVARWKKDSLSMKYFQYGNAFLPTGENPTEYLAVTTVAVRADDLVTTIFRLPHAK